MKKMKVLVFFLAAICLFNFNVNSVKADCLDCDVSNCADCGCVLSKSGNSCVYDNFNVESVSCGKNTLTGIPKSVPKIVSFVYIIIQVLVPVLLVVIGSIDLIKSMTAQKEDNMKKSQQMFIKRFISAILIFFLFVFVKLFISVVSDSSDSGVFDCFECFIKNNDKCDGGSRRT